MFTLEGNIVTNKGIFRKSIEINDSGIISKIGSPTGAADFIFWEELIFPGFIDLHVHAREDAGHAQDYKEDFTTAGEAAIHGGVVALADMPNNTILPVDDKSYLGKVELAKKSTADVLLYAILTPASKPLSFPVPYKAFTSKSVGEAFFSQFPDLEEAVKKYQGQNISFHCEDPEIIRQNQNQLTHEKQRPKEAEIRAIEFVLHLIEKYNIKGKICHCSTVEGLEKIINAKKRGVTVTVEVTPHHLYFDEAMLNEGNRNLLQVNPPIRGNKENRLALIEALRKGEIDYLASDHAPHTVEEKEKGASGLPQLDTFGPFVAWLMKEHDFTPEEIARVCSENPANFFNEFKDIKYGKIEEGYTGSLTILDINKPIMITKEILKTKCGWSPFERVTFPGSVVMTIVKGKVYKNA
ncbi:MAG: Allantoinase [Candidatus Nomurabacteria bacterium GW2011_GWB1_47_6]|uniref:Allantoinase n=1 Tax=Candidatus Nomurabacteria bacterium GW2011_GWB1_47_6 TaxID=1618749 RepID=A0A0G1VCQ8_9BACT|nr:MAG: Allantoinase [Candidatus Nomurabacteria bacterium GW2011_GWB1_47_6]